MRKGPIKDALFVFAICGLLIVSLLLGPLLYGLASSGSLSELTVEALFSRENLMSSVAMAVPALVGAALWFIWNKFRRVRDAEHEK